MTSPIDAQHIMDEIQRLAAEHRQRLSDGLREGLDTTDLDRPIVECRGFADLQAPAPIPYDGWRRRIIAALDWLRRRFLQGILIRQSAVNRDLITSLERLAARVESLHRHVRALDAITSRSEEGAVSREAGGAPAAAPAELAAQAAAPVGGACTSGLRASAAASSAGMPYASSAACMPGDEHTLRERRRIYLDYVGPPDPARMILDVGCGRGEFLGLLSAAGHTARGVDSCPESIARCRAQGLSVVEADALPYLLSLPDASLAGVFAGRFIEHLALDDLVAFVHACHSKVQPGGRVIFETINTDSLSGLRAFYADLSHRRPIPPAAARFLLEASGFEHIVIIYLNPVPSAEALVPCPADSPLHEHLNAAFEKLNRLLFGPQDYAVMATR
jgi:SAM-dependent methyltransferase